MYRITSQSRATYSLKIFQPPKTPAGRAQGTPPSPVHPDSQVCLCFANTLDSLKVFMTKQLWIPFFSFLFFFFLPWGPQSKFFTSCPWEDIKLQWSESRYNHHHQRYNCFSYQNSFMPTLIAIKDSVRVPLPYHLSV